MFFCKPYVPNRIIESKYEMYKNKLLYKALKRAKPITRTNWVQSELPIINKKSILEMKDRTRIKGFIDIAQENLKFFNRLQKSKSSYNILNYNHDYILNKKYSDNLRKFKYTSKNKNNKGFRNIFNHNNSALNVSMKEYPVS